MALDFQPSQDSASKIDFLPLQQVLPDPVPVQNTVRNNLSQHLESGNEETEKPLPEFHQALDIGIGMPISQMLGKDGQELSRS